MSQVPALSPPKGAGGDWKSLLRFLRLISKEGAGAPATTAEWCRVTSTTWAAAEAE